MNDFKNQIEVRNTQIHGETDWHWVKSDSGAFGRIDDGPMRDWMESHSLKYFKYLRSNDLIVTGGACCGMHVRFYAKRFNTVVAYEPDPRSFHCMVNNAPYDNVVKLNAAMGDKPGFVRFSRQSEQNIGMNQVHENGQLHVPVIPIDSLALQACSMIQLDVEGYEDLVLRGAVETIKRFKPVIAAERYHHSHLLESLDYQVVDQSISDVIWIPSI